MLALRNPENIDEKCYIYLGVSSTIIQQQRSAI